MVNVYDKKHCELYANNEMDIYYLVATNKKICIHVAI